VKDRALSDLLTYCFRFCRTCFEWFVYFVSQLQSVCIYCNL